MPPSPYYPSAPKAKKSPLMLVVAVVIALSFILMAVYAAVNTFTYASSQNNGNSYVNQCGFNYETEFTDKLFYGTSTTMEWTYPDKPGDQFAIVTMKIVNNGPLTVSTHPRYWNFVSSGIVYYYDSNTWAYTLDYSTVEMMKGGSVVTQIVYQVPAEVTSGKIVWDGYASSAVKNYAYQDSSITVSVPTSVDAPVAHSIWDGETLTGYSVTIKATWSSVPNASFYEIQSSDSPDFSFIEQTYSTMGNEATFEVMPEFLSYTGDYYIRVRAYTGWGGVVSDWSNVITCHLELSV